MLSKPSYRTDIDGLRAVAVLAVMVNHAYESALPGGFVGVDVFFVISGYLITGIVESEMDAGTFSFAAFYERRVRRLAPNLLALMLFCAVVSWFVLLPPDFSNFADSLFSTSLFASNFFFWRDGWYFAAPSQMKPLLHTWSLAIEEQFYLVFPVVLWLLTRYLPRRRRAACVAACALSFALSVWAVRNTQAAAFYLLPTRAWELLLGAVLAAGVVPALTTRAAREGFAAAGVLAIALAVSLLDSTAKMPGLGALLPCAGAAMVIHAGSGAAPGSVARFLGWKPLATVGLASYSLYLWHWPLLAFGRYYFLSAFRGPTLAVFVSASVAIALLAWRYIEQPVRRKRVLGSRRAVVSMAVVGTAAVLVFAAGGVRSNGFANRFAGADIIDYQEVIANVGRDTTGRCFLQPSRTVNWSESVCTHEAASPDSGARSVFLIGDSFAAEFSNWMRENYPGTVLEFTAASCPPLFGYAHPVRQDWCAEINAKRMQVLRSRQFTDVFIGGFWGQAEHANVGPALERTVQDILATGVQHVTVLGTVPHFDDSPIDVINRSRIFGRNVGDSLPATLDPALRVTLDRLARIEGVRVINVSDLVCARRACRYALGGDLLFADAAAHMTGAGVATAMRTSDWLMPGPNR